MTWAEFTESVAWIGIIAFGVFVVIVVIALAVGVAERIADWASGR